MKYICQICGWVYDEEQGAPEQGVAPGTKFEDLPEDFACELCGVGKENFAKEQKAKIRPGGRIVPTG